MFSVTLLCCLEKKTMYVSIYLSLLVVLISQPAKYEDSCRGPEVDSSKSYCTFIIEMSVYLKERYMGYINYMLE